jgi:penicillin-binding protein 1A
MGIHTQLKPVPSAVLGTNPVNPLDMASAYGTFATNGVHHPPVAIKKITNASGRVLYRDDSHPTRVLPPEVSYITTTALAQVVQRGTGVAANIGRPEAGKTGTAEEYRDAWFIGYTPALVAAVSMGYPQGEIEMKPYCGGSEPGVCRPTRTITSGGVVGGSFPAQIWARFMLKALADVPPAPFAVPSSGVVSVIVDTRTGCLAGAFTPPQYRATETFAQGTQPLQTCPQPGDRVPVPKVVGLMVAQAVQALNNAGFGVAQQKRSSPSTPGEVIGQNPRPGSDALPGSTVTLIVSAGRSRPSPTASPRAASTVPSVIGETEARAEALLKSHGFSVHTVTKRRGHSKKDRGIVWRQSPSAGARAKPGSAVTIWVNPG